MSQQWYIRSQPERSDHSTGTQTFRYDETSAPPTIPNEHYEALRTEWINPPSVRAQSPARSSRTRKHSPARTARTARSVPRHPSPPRVQERIIIREQPAPPPVVQAPPAPAVPQPLAIYLPDRNERSEAELKAEIRALEAERSALRYERQADAHSSRGHGHGHGHSHGQEIIVRERPEEEYQVVEYRPRQERREVVEYVDRERERDRSPPRNVVRVEKDRKGRMALVRSAH